MNTQDILFVFHGQSGQKAARFFDTMVRMQMERGGGQSAHILLLKQQKGKGVSPVDLTAPAAGGILEHPKNKKIELIVSDDCDLQVVTLGEYSDVIELISEDNFEIILPEPPKPLHTPEVESVEAAEEEPLEVPPPMVAFHFTHIPLLPQKAAEPAKPRKDVFLESDLPYAPGQYKWTSSEYIQQELLQRVSRLAERTRSLHARLSEYDHWMDLLDFFSFKTNDENLEARVVQRFNTLACSNAICQTALRLEKFKDLPLPVSVGLSERSLRHAAVFLPLTYKEGLHVETRVTKGHMNAYRVIFAQPVPDRLSLVKLVRKDMEMKHSVLYFHELNRKMLETEIFGTKVSLPFYDADTLGQSLEYVSDGNHLQSLLEVKEVFYAAHQKQQLQRCLSLFRAQDLHINRL